MFCFHLPEFVRCLSTKKSAVPRQILPLPVTPSTNTLKYERSSDVKNDREALPCSVMMFGFQYKVKRRSGFSESIFSGV